MQRRVKRAGVAIHPVMAPVALGLLAAGTALDVLAAGHAGALSWLAFWSIVAGVALGTWSAAFALLDWIFFAELGEAGTCGLGGFTTALVVGLYGLAALLRVDLPAHGASAPAMAVEVVAAAALGVDKWIGREMAAWLDGRR